MSTASTAEAKVTIVNKSASVATITYTNWEGLTSRAIVVPAGSSFVTYNWHGPDDVGDEVATVENIFNLPLEEYDPPASPLVKVLLADFAYDKDKVSITLTYSPQ